MRTMCLVLAGSLLSGVPARTPGLLIFGGDDNKVFLGCLNCSEFDASSVHNKYGAYGSPYSSTSILNHYSEYGSQYANYSACNPYASQAPVIVDGDGRFYGRLTVNKYAPDRTSDASIRAWLTGVCESA